jgi:hypothetical protein
MKKLALALLLLSCFVLDSHAQAPQPITVPVVPANAPQGLQPSQAPTVPSKQVPARSQTPAVITAPIAAGQGAAPQRGVPGTARSAVTDGGVVIQAAKGTTGKCAPRQDGQSPELPNGQCRGVQ